MNENQIIRRRLPPELLSEMHKCLPLADAINVLVNVPTRAIYQNNSPRMHRTVQRIKTSLKEYIGTLVDGGGNNNNREILRIYNNIEWKPQFDLFLHYAGWLTSIRELRMANLIVGMPENFVERLLLHLAKASSTQLMLPTVDMDFGRAPIPMPTFLEQLLNKEKKFLQIGNRTLFESFELKTDNGQILRFYDGESDHHYRGNYKLRLVVANKIDGKNWFEILMTMNYSRKQILQLEFSQLKLQPLDENEKYEWNYDEYPIHGQIEENGNKLEAENIYWNFQWDMFFRRGAYFTKFRHIKIKQKYYCIFPRDYVDFLIRYVSSTKHPAELLDSIEFNLDRANVRSSTFIDKILEISQNEIPKGGKVFNVGTKKLHILSAKTVNNKLELILANMPTNGEYLFGVKVQFGDGLERIVGITIQKRKDGDIVEMKSNYQQIEHGKKRKKAANDEDGPNYFGKIVKK